MNTRRAKEPKTKTKLAQTLNFPPWNCRRKLRGPSLSKLCWCVRAAASHYMPPEVHPCKGDGWCVSEGRTPTPAVAAIVLVHLTADDCHERCHINNDLHPRQLHPRSTFGFTLRAVAAVPREVGSPISRTHFLTDPRSGGVQSRSQSQGAGWAIPY